MISYITIFKKVSNFHRLCFFCAVLIFGSYVAYKILPSYLGIEWSQHKKVENQSYDIHTGKNGKKNSKLESKEKYFEYLNKYEWQIKLDKAATIYLYGVPVLPSMYFLLTKNIPYFNMFIFAEVNNMWITKVAKDSFKHQRPDGSNNRSFPSGHTSQTFSLAGFMHAFYGFKIAMPFYILGAIVGVTRVLCERHQELDILFGAIVGIVSGYYSNVLVIVLFRRYFSKIKCLQKLYKWLKI